MPLPLALPASSSRAESLSVTDVLCDIMMGTRLGMDANVTDELYAFNANARLELSNAPLFNVVDVNDRVLDTDSTSSAYTVSLSVVSTMALFANHDANTDTALPAPTASAGPNVALLPIKMQSESNAAVDNATTPLPHTPDRP